MGKKVLSRVGKSILAIFTLFFTACPKPIDLNAFLEDEKVQEIIEITTNPPPPPTPVKKTVVIDRTSDDFASLRADDSKITGLTPGRYYRVEEYDDTGEFKGNLFVQADGTHWGDLSLIDRLTGTQITNLKNDYIYRVKYARPFADGTHDYFVWDDAAAKNAAISSGTVAIIGSDDYFLDLSAVIDVSKDYEVMKIPVPGLEGTITPWGDSRTSARLKSSYFTSAIPVPTPTSTLYGLYDTGKVIGIYQYSGYVGTTPHINNTSIIRLEGINTETDYVFAEYDADGEITNFIVLSVERLDDNATFNVTATVSLAWSGPVTPSLSTSTPSYSQGGSITINVIVSNTTAFSAYTWYVDGTEAGGQTGSTLTITGNVNTALNLYQQGIHTVTLVATDAADSKQYSGSWDITCNP